VIVQRASWQLAFRRAFRDCSDHIGLQRSIFSVFIQCKIRCSPDCERVTSALLSICMTKEKTPRQSRLACSLLTGLTVLTVNAVLAVTAAAIPMQTPGDAGQMSTHPMASAIAHIVFLAAMIGMGAAVIAIIFKPPLGK
jgi:hypothetical protein